VHTFWHRKKRWKWISHKPALIRRLKENPGKTIYLTTEQIDRLKEEAKQDHSPYIYPFIVIGLETSMRKSEILSIRLKNIHLERRIIYIPNAKAGPRDQPITANLVQFLKSYIDLAKPDQEWLFPTNSPSGHFRWIEIPFRRVIKKTGLDPKQVTPHTLRHTAISHLVQAGVDLPTVQRISGHKTLAMVERYSHQNGPHIQAAMDKLEKRYQNAG